MSDQIAADPEKKSGARWVLKRVLPVALLFGAAYWVVDGIFEHLFFRDNLRFLITEGAQTLWQALVTKVSPHGLFFRISFVIGALIGGLLVSWFLVKKNRIEAELRQSGLRLRRLGTELALAEERQRRLIASDIHDNLCQNLALATLKLKTAAEGLKNHQLLSRPVDDALELIQEMTRDARSLIQEISPPILHDMGLVPALEWFAEQVEEKHGARVAFQADGDPSFPMEWNLLLFRAVRELLINVVKHARASHAMLRLEGKDGHFEISVQDNGVGFDPSAGRSEAGGSGFGLLDVSERLESIGGRVRVDAAPGRGTRITLVVPDGAGVV